MNKKSLIKQADALYARWFHDKYKRCAVCGDSPVELHHLISRGNKLSRFEKLNAIPLCSHHHKDSRLLSAHGSPKEFDAWLEIHHPEQYDYYIKHKYQTGVSLPESWYREQVQRLEEDL